MVSACPPISNFSSPLSEPLGTVLSVPITVDITVTFLFHSFLSFLARSKYLSLFSLSWIFTLWSTGTTKSTIQRVLFFLLIITISGLLAEIRWECLYFKIPGNFMRFILQNGFWFVRVPFGSMVRFQFLAQFPVNTFPIIIIIIIIIYSLRVFHISVSWWSFTEIWMTATLLKSPGLFSVFWPISIMYK